MFERFLLTLPAFVGQFFRCAFIAAVIGSMAFPFGQVLPRQSFHYRSFPYAPFRWERNGMIYTKLRIQFWKDKMPDMSKHVKSAFKKKITDFRSPEYIEILIRETCVAEFVHWILILISPIYLLLMHGENDWIWMALNVLGNIPFILIQRYNRPRLVTVLNKQIELYQGAHAH